MNLASNTSVWYRGGCGIVGGGVIIAGRVRWFLFFGFKVIKGIGVSRILGGEWYCGLIGYQKERT